MIQFSVRENTVCRGAFSAEKRSLSLVWLFCCFLHFLQTPEQVRSRAACLGWDTKTFKLAFVKITTRLWAVVLPAESTTAREKIPCWCLFQVFTNLLPFSPHFNHHVAEEIIIYWNILCFCSREHKIVASRPLSRATVSVNKRPSKCKN